MWVPHHQHDITILLQIHHPFVLSRNFHRTDIHKQEHNYKSTKTITGQVNTNRSFPLPSSHLTNPPYSIVLSIAIFPIYFRFTRSLLLRCAVGLVFSIFFLLLFWSTSGILSANRSELCKWKKWYDNWSFKEYNHRTNKNDSPITNVCPILLNFSFLYTLCLLSYQVSSSPLDIS